LAVRLVSDIFLGFFAWPLMLAVYASHLAGVLFGLWIKKSTTPSRQGGTPLPGSSPGQALFQEGNTAAAVSPPRIGGVRHEVTGGGMNQWAKVIASSLGASIIFFLVTNFAFLYPGYTHDIAGITSAYVNGLPFFRGTVLGDLGYTAALFGAYQFALYAKTINRLKRAIA
jgi:hypothetical protein